MKRRLDRSSRTFVALVAVLWTTVATAEVGSDTSRSVRLDVRAPVLELLQSPASGQYDAGHELHILWTVDEDHASWSDTAHTARIVRNGAVLDERNYPHASGQYLWLWTVPELSLGDVYVEITVTDRYGNTSRVEGNRFTILASTTGVDTPPRVSALDAAPNPFNPSTRIRLAAAESGAARLTVYDLQGRRVRTLLRGPVEAGVRHVDWDGRDDAGRALSAGSYLLRFDLPGETLSRKVVLLP